MKSKKWLYILVGVISPIFSIAGMTLFNIPVGILRAGAIVWLLYVYGCFRDFCRLKKKRAKASERLKELINKKRFSELKYSDTSKAAINKERQERKKDCIKIDKKCDKIRGNIIKACILFAVFYIPRSEPIISFGQRAVNVIFAPFSEEDEREKSSDFTGSEEPDEKDNAENIKGSTESEEPAGEIETTDSKGQVNQAELTDPEQGTLVKLDLEFPNGYPGIDDEMKELYNSLFYPGEENIEEIMLSNITVWIGSCKSNAPLDNATTDNGESAQYFSGIEAEFSNANIVLSDLLDVVIDGREELLDSYPNGTLLWLLANNYQTYALNYAEKTKSANSVLYFYMKSIDCAQTSLKFNMTDKDKIINYVRCRFKDIGDCKILDEDVRLRAYEIYHALDYAMGRYYSNHTSNKTA